MSFFFTSVRTYFWGRFFYLKNLSSHGFIFISPKGGGVNFSSVIVCNIFFFQKKKRHPYGWSVSKREIAAVLYGDIQSMFVWYTITTKYSWVPYTMEFGKHLTGLTGEKKEWKNMHFIPRRLMYIRILSWKITTSQITSTYFFQKFFLNLTPRC